MIFIRWVIIFQECLMVGFNKSFLQLFFIFIYTLGRETVGDLVGLLYLVDFIKNLLEDAVKEASTFAIEYEQYSYLWKDDKHEKLLEILADFERKKNAFLMLEKFKEEVILINFKN